MTNVSFHCFDKSMFFVLIHNSRIFPSVILFILDVVGNILGLCIFSLSCYFFLFHVKTVCSKSLVKKIRPEIETIQNACRRSIPPRLSEYLKKNFVRHQFQIHRTFSFHLQTIAI